MARLLKGQKVVIVGGPWPIAVHGAMRERCALCHGFLSLSDASQRLMASPADIVFLCWACLAKCDEKILSSFTLGPSFEGMQSYQRDPHTLKSKPESQAKNGTLAVRANTT